MNKPFVPPVSTKVRGKKRVGNDGWGELINGWAKSSKYVCCEYSVF